MRVRVRCAGASVSAARGRRRRRRHRATASRRRRTRRRTRRRWFSPARARDPRAPSSRNRRGIYPSPPRPPSPLRRSPPLRGGSKRFAKVRLHRGAKIDAKFLANARDSELVAKLVANDGREARLERRARRRLPRRRRRRRLGTVPREPTAARGDRGSRRVAPDHHAVPHVLLFLLLLLLLASFRPRQLGAIFLRRVWVLGHAAPHVRARRRGVATLRRRARREAPRRRRAFPRRRAQRFGEIPHVLLEERQTRGEIRVGAQSVAEFAASLGGFLVKLARLVPEHLRQRLGCSPSSASARAIAADAPTRRVACRPAACRRDVEVVGIETRRRCSPRRVRSATRHGGIGFALRRSVRNLRRRRNLRREGGFEERGRRVCFGFGLSRGFAVAFRGPVRLGLDGSRARRRRRLGDWRRCPIEPGAA